MELNQQVSIISDVEFTSISDADLNRVPVVDDANGAGYIFERKQRNIPGSRTRRGDINRRLRSADCAEPVIRREQTPTGGATRTRIGPLGPGFESRRGDGENWQCAKQRCRSMLPANASMC